MQSISKSPKTISRIETIKAIVQCHRENILRLKYKYQFRKNECQKGKANWVRTINYDCIPYSEERYHFTVKNLQQQIEFLENELIVLMEYGA